ncbi:MAG: HD domain-containing phosphohydrolase [Methylomonas sp.]|jgi:response regulator RpfG family c-di-GMP phosphodiesterase
MNETIADISRKILFVDDEILLLEGVRRQLRREIDVTVAAGSLTGLEVFAEQGPFAVVISDYNMPGMDGITFLNEIYQRNPETVLVMLTGRAELDIAVNALHNAHISRFLNKPCPKEILLETIYDGLEQYRLRVSEQILQRELQASNQRLHDLNNHLEILVAQKTRALQIQYQFAAQMTLMSDTEEIAATFIGTLTELTGLTDLQLWLSPMQDGHFIRHYPSEAGLFSFDGRDCPRGLIAETLATNNAWYREDRNGNAAALSEFDRGLIGGDLLMLSPLINNHRLIGFLSLAGEPAAILKNDVRNAVTAMADIAATALLSRWQREAQDEAEDAIITALAKLSEYRDPETGAHLERLKRYCQLLCQHLGQTDKFRAIVTPEFSKDLVRSSPLHDIGKVGIEDAILKKPGRLTPDEFEIMKTHAQIGGDTLRTVYEQFPSQGFIKCGMDVAYGHHEKWDGNGYPRGLKGEQIPLVARILALVDVYDALTCRRVYKPPFPREQANGIILEGKGSHFDPDIVEAFVQLESQFHQISVELADEIAESPCD